MVEKALVGIALNMVGVLAFCVAWVVASYAVMWLIMVTWPWCLFIATGALFWYNNRVDS